MISGVLLRDDVHKVRGKKSCGGSKQYDKTAGPF